MRNAAKKRLPKFRGNGRASELRGGFRPDLRDASSARQVARRAIELGNGHIDIYGVNVTGVVHRLGPTHGNERGVVRQSLFAQRKGSTVHTTFRTSWFAELAPLMANRGKRGNCKSLDHGCRSTARPVTSLYGSSKAAINLLTKTWTAEYGGSGVRINAVA